MTHDHNATVPMRRTRTWSREFCSAPTPMTPVRAHLHSFDTVPTPTPTRRKLQDAARAVQTTGRFEDKFASHIKRSHARSWVLGVAVSVALGLLGLGVGYLFAAVAVGRV